MSEKRKLTILVFFILLVCVLSFHFTYLLNYPTYELTVEQKEQELRREFQRHKKFIDSTIQRYREYAIREAEDEAEAERIRDDEEEYKEWKKNKKLQDQTIWGKKLKEIKEQQIN